MGIQTFDNIIIRDDLENEVNDIRIGYDGTQYSGAGKSVRGQFLSVLNEDLIAECTWVKGFLSTTGEESVNTQNIRAQKYVEIKDDQSVIIDSSAVSSFVCRVCFYDENKTFISYRNTAATLGYTKLLPPSGARYMRLAGSDTWSTGVDPSFGANIKIYMLPNYTTTDEYTANLALINKINEGTTNGLTYSVDAVQGEFVVNGTATAEAQRVMSGEITLQPGKYLFGLRDCPSPIFDSSAELRIVNSSFTRIAGTRTKAGFELSSAQSVYISIYYPNGLTFDNLVLRPFLVKYDDYNDELPSAVSAIDSVARSGVDALDKKTDSDNLVSSIIYSDNFTYRGLTYRTENDALIVNGTAEAATWHVFTDFIELEPGIYWYGALDGNNASDYFLALYDVVTNSSVKTTGGFSPFTVTERKIVFAAFAANNGAVVNNYTVHPLLMKEKTVSELNGKSEVEDKLKQLKLNNVNSLPSVTFLHYSDLHSNDIALRRLMEFRSEYSAYIDDVLDTGDLVNNANNSITFYDNIDGTEKILRCIGNHETWDGSNNWHVLNAAGAYNRYFAPYISNWGVTSETYVCYYYKDYASSKLRLIVLDNMNEDATQLQWFINTLEEARTLEYDVLIACHTIMAKSDDEIPFVPLETPWQNPYANTASTATVFPVKVGLAYAQATVDFVNNGGVVIAWLAGHMHADAAGTYEGILNIAITTAGDLGFQRTYEIRTKQQRSYDAFNVVGVDTQNKLIKIARVGMNYSHAMQHLDTFCWDYMNKKIVQS